MKRVVTLGAVLLAASASLGAQAPTLTGETGIELVLIRPGSFVLGTFAPPYPRPPVPGAAPAAPAAPAPPTAPAAPTAQANPTGAAAPAAAAAGGRGQGARGGGRGGGPALTAEEYARIEAMARADAMPGFRVTIERPYYIGKYEVTQAQWRRVMGNNPSTFQGAKVQGSSDDMPVENITWDDAQAFLRRLNALEKTTRYRLPTEFEWEYAARAGAEGDIAWTDIREQAWAGSNRSTRPVGQMKPNAWGLYDTLGNVWEWVQDYYNEKLFADPVPPTSGTQRVLKGAGFASDVKNATWMTHAAGPGSKFDVGFRVVRDVGN
jgi:sulfatase modifying factor 1